MVDNGKKSESKKSNAILEKLISRMSLPEKIGQLFQVGFNGSRVTSEIREMITDYKVGGIIYFRRNIASIPQIAKLSDGLQELSINEGSGLPLIISIDQEGGLVNRINEITHFPGNMTLGATKNPELAQQSGKYIALQLKALGINMDFAPVLDINNNPLNPVIGTRSFGGDPLLVANLGVAFIKGMQGEGVIACAKHFPGHGDTDVDSHLALPVIKHKKEYMLEVELYPFQQAINSGVDSIMTAHIYFPALDPEKGLPATLSYNILTGLLREELGFTGIIISDCMEMKAIAESFGTVAGAVKSIQAGADLILISHSIDKQREAVTAVVESVKEGSITEERINQSLFRILNLKRKKIGLESLPVSDYKKIDQEMEEKVAYRISREGVTLVKNEDGLIPVNMSRLSNKRILMIDFLSEKVTLAGDGQESNNIFINLFRAEGIEVEHYIFKDNSPELPPLEGVGLIIIVSSNAVYHPEQIKIVDKLNTEDILLVIVSANPYNLQAFPKVSTFLAIYDNSPSNLKVAYEVIVGRHKAQGTLPVILKY
ncbi:MAG TPA: beta-N-acetylhexosaminidase [Atribacterota bacterium]|nr:beta-N-acetylhexosaminidase [Atribacterota bacterium]